MRLRSAASLAPFVLLACTFNTHVDLPPPPAVDLSALPHADPAGRITLVEVAGSRLDIDPSQSDALTALGACADLVTYCASPSRPLDACVDDARACGTDTPWREDAPCCPTACRDAYHRARASGASPIEAFDAVWFANPDCFPGARAALEGRS